MSTSEPDRLRLAKDALASLLTGTSITLCLALLRAAQVMPELAEVLLRPGPYLARRARTQGVANLLLSVMADGIIYGSLPFLLLRLLRKPRAGMVRLALNSDRRRAQRAAMAAPVLVYGWAGGEPFAENTETLNVSAIGGLVPLEADVIPAQSLLVINIQTNREMLCRAIRSLYTSDGKPAIGFEFPEKSPSFWQENGTPASEGATTQDSGHVSGEASGQISGQVSGQLSRG